jgi:trehalose/maltose transport system substrate-binding protein
MNRLHLITAACAGLVLALSGCGPASPARSRVTTLRLMLPPSERPFWEPIARAFERRHPGARVDLVEGAQDTDLRENLYTASLLARDPTFDLVYGDVTWTPKFAGAGWLEPLDDRVSAAERDAFLPAAVEAGVYEGRLYRVPVRTDIGLLYYRTDLLWRARRAPPRTFEELEQAARALQAPPRVWGFVWQGKQYEGLVCNYLEVLEGYGGFWIDPATNEVGLDREEAMNALRFLVRCMRDKPISPPGVATYQEEESRRLFQDGRAVFLRNWPYCWSLAQSKDSPVRGRIGVIPMVHGPKGESASTLGGWGLSISRYSRHPDLAMEFIRAATSAEGQRMLCAPTGYAPARIDSYRDPVLLAANPFLTELRKLHEHARARPTIARYALASDILQRHLSAALAGIADPAITLHAAARETRAVLESAHPAQSATAGAP